MSGQPPPPGRYLWGMEGSSAAGLPGGPQGSRSPPRGPAEELRRASRWAQITLGVAGVVVAAMAALAWLGAFVSAGVIWESVDVAVVRTVGFGMLAAYAIVMLVAGWVFIDWMWHAEDQASTAQPRVAARFRRGWIIGGWFVPVANWIIPKLIVNDLWQRPPAVGEHATPRPGRPVPAPFQWWWGLWLVYAIPSGFVSPVDADPSTGVFVLYAVSHTAAVAAAVLAVVVVRQLTDRLTCPADTTGG